MTTRGALTTRLVVAGAVVVVATQLAACQRACTGISLDYGDDAQGAEDERAALAVFLDGQQAQGFPSEGWDGPSSSGVFTNGPATVTVTRYPGTQGWFVTGAQTC